jgi:electron transfer flavoprotein alpha/beta subunit
MFALRLVIADGSVEVTREVDGGMQTISQKRPAITTTDLRPDDLRYPSLPNIMNKKKPIYAKTPTDLGVDVAPRDPAARRHFNTSLDVRAASIMPLERIALAQVRSFGRAI